VLRRRGSSLVLALLGLLPFASSCSSSDSGSIQLVTGGETDTFTQSPVPTTLTVQAVDTSGNVTTLASAPLSAATIDLGQQDESTIATIEVTGSNSTGDSRIVFGASVPLIFGGLNGVTVPIFVQRVGQLARVPGGIGDTRQVPLLANVQGEYLFAAGGFPTSLATTTELYDFGGFSLLSSPPTLPLSPQSVAFVGTVGWFFASDGTATYFDLSSGSSVSIPALAGGSFADIAGGATIVGDNGVQFIVGATRTSGTPTSAILEIDPNDTSNASYQNGGPTWLALSAPRLGAAASWVTGTGLVVVGGSATAAGVEVLAESGTTGTTATKGTGLLYPPDPSAFAGATTLSPSTVLVAGGVSATGTDPGVRTIDLGCMTSCSPNAWATPLTVPLGTAQAFTMSASEAFVVGNEVLTGATHTYTVTSTAMTEVPTKVTHTNARALWSPVGSIALVGGSDSIETFVF
jgi:hypothetical protein